MLGISFKGMKKFIIWPTADVWTELKRKSEEGVGCLQRPFFFNSFLSGHFSPPDFQSQRKEKGCRERRKRKEKGR